jgi:hypothetical protein
MGARTAERRWIARPVLAATGVVLAIVGAVPVFGAWGAGATAAPWYPPSPVVLGGGRLVLAAAATTTLPPETTTTLAPETTTTLAPETTTTLGALEVDFQAVAGTGGDADAVPLAGGVFAVDGGASCTTDGTGACTVTSAPPASQICWQETTAPPGWAAGAPGCASSGSTGTSGMTIAVTQLPATAPIAGRATDASTQTAVPGSTYDLYRVDPPSSPTTTAANPSPSEAGGVAVTFGPNGQVTVTATGGTGTTDGSTTTSTTSTTVPAASAVAPVEGTLIWVARATSGIGGAVTWPPQQIGAVYCAEEVTAAAGYQLDSTQHCLDAPLTTGGGGTIDLPAQPDVPAAPTPVTVPPVTAAPAVAVTLGTAPMPPSGAAAVVASTPPASAAPATAPASPPPAAGTAPVPGSLPFTGAATRVLARMGTGLIALGAALVLASHRRRPTRPAAPGPRFRTGSP